MNALKLQGWLFALCIATGPALFPTVVHAQDTPEPGYVCTIEGRTVQVDWIPTDIVVVANGLRARVHDNVLKRLNRKPVRAEVIQNTDKLLVVSWRVPMRVENSSTVLTYRVAIFRDSRKMNFSVNAAHAFIKETGHGSCDLADKFFDTK